MCGKHSPVPVGPAQAEGLPEARAVFAGHGEAPPKDKKDDQGSAPSQRSSLGLKRGVWGPGWPESTWGSGKMLE